MSLYELNGTEVDIDMEDIDFQEIYTKAFEKMEEEEKGLQNAGKLTDISRAYCKLFYDLFDRIFGEGKGEEILGEKMNTRVVDETYDEFISICSDQSKQILARKAKQVNKYKPNRQQRRSKR